METNREITIIDLVRLLQLPDYYMTITTYDDEHVYKVCSVEVCASNAYNKGNIFYTNLDGEDPIETCTFCLDSYHTMYTQPESVGIVISAEKCFAVATLEMKPVNKLPSIEELLDNN